MWVYDAPVPCFLLGVFIMKKNALLQWSRLVKKFGKWVEGVGVNLISSIAKAIKKRAQFVPHFVV